MAKAKDIMSGGVVTVRPDTPIHEAVGLLAEHDITGIPVVDASGAPVGILSEKDVLCLMHEDPASGRHLVSDFMTQPAITFDVEEPVGDICECLATYHFRRVPVTRDGRIVGIISRRDVLTYMIETNVVPAASRV